MGKKKNKSSKNSKGRGKEGLKYLKNLEKPFETKLELAGDCFNVIYSCCCSTAEELEEAFSDYEEFDEYEKFKKSMKDLVGKGKALKDNVFAGHWCNFTRIDFIWNRWDIRVMEIDGIKYARGVRIAGDLKTTFVGIFVSPTIVFSSNCRQKNVVTKKELRGYIVLVVVSEIPPGKKKKEKDSVLKSPMYGYRSCARILLRWKRKDDWYKGSRLVRASAQIVLEKYRKDLLKLEKKKKKKKKDLKNISDLKQKIDVYILMIKEEEEEEKWEEDTFPQYFDKEDQVYRNLGNVENMSDEEIMEYTLNIPLSVVQKDSAHGCYIASSVFNTRIVEIGAKLLVLKRKKEEELEDEESEEKKDDPNFCTDEKKNILCRTTLSLGYQCEHLSYTTENGDGYCEVVFPPELAEGKKLVDKTDPNQKYYVVKKGVSIMVADQSIHYEKTLGLKKGSLALCITYEIEGEKMFKNSIRTHLILMGMENQRSLFGLGNMHAQIQYDVKSIYLMNRQEKIDQFLDVLNEYTVFGEKNRKKIYPKYLRYSVVLEGLKEYMKEGLNKKVGKPDIKMEGTWDDGVKYALNKKIFVSATSSVKDTKKAWSGEYIHPRIIYSKERAENCILIFLMDNRQARKIEFSDPFLGGRIEIEDKMILKV